MYAGCCLGQLGLRCVRLRCGEGGRAGREAGAQVEFGLVMVGGTWWWWTVGSRDEMALCVYA